ncbi:MAG: phosphotriesterase-related protein [Leptotrichiaceae bacterium]|nr:phosphotriesterase-related protein [Leptotrichiaceae bacterium]
MLKDGYTLMHEHIFIDLSGVKKLDDCRLDCKDETIKEFKELYENGVRNVTDVTNIGMGRNIDYIKEVSEKSGINVICATGFYKEPFYPDFVYEKSEKELSEIMKKEISEGIDGTDVKAGIIGEIGSSKDKITDTELKVFKAAIIAHLETGAPITTHTSLGTMGHEQVKLFKEYNVNPDKVVIGHTDLSGNGEYVLKMLYNGVYIEFDTIGKNNYMSDDIRIEILKEIEKRDLIDRVFLSLDITRKSNMKYNGGIGYNYIFDRFIPKLRESGIKESSVEKMLKTNPKKFFE